MKDENLETWNELNKVLNLTFKSLFKLIFLWQIINCERRYDIHNDIVELQCWRKDIESYQQSNETSGI